MGLSWAVACALDHPFPNTPTKPRQRILQPAEALHLLKQSNSPNQTKHLHAQILRNPHLSLNPTLLSNLIRLYSSHGLLNLASNVFSSHFTPTSPPPTFAYNLLIRAHTSNHSYLNAILLYNRMILNINIAPDSFTFPFVIKACAALADVSKGKEVHAFAIKSGFYNDPYLHNSLIHFYFASSHPEYGRKVFDKMRVRTVVSWTALVSGLVECGEIDEARRVFEVAPVRNVVTWTAIIDGCARNGRAEEAFELFWKMLESNVRPNEFTVVGLLIACIELGSLELGQRVHEFAKKNRFDRGVYVGTALIDMYSKCGSLEDAVGVFDGMTDRSLATWNSMITSLGVHGFGEKAVELFGEMEKENVRPDGITLVGVLCACVREGMVEEGWRLFRYMREKYVVEVGREQYRCLVDLLDCCEEIEMVRDLVMELDVREQRMLLMACQARGNMEIESIVRNCVDELKVSDNNIGSLGQREESGCFVWEVG